jgi:phage shock protein PspC (stress-responsive transcriptional regulator)
MHDCNAFQTQLTTALVEDNEVSPASLHDARTCDRCRPLLRDLATAVSLHVNSEGELEPAAMAATRAIASGRRWAIAMYGLGKLINVGVSLTIVVAWLAFIELRDVGPLDLGLHDRLRETLVTFTVAGVGLLALVGWRGRRLYARWPRRQLQGICTGLAEYFRLPLWLVRLAFVWSFFAGLGGGTIYFLLAFLVDFHPDDRHHLLGFRIARWWRRRRGTTA